MSEMFSPKRPSSINNPVSHRVHPEALGHFCQMLQKSMMRKFCLEIRREWDEGLPIVFPMLGERSTGFRAAELVFGPLWRGVVCGIATGQGWRSGFRMWCVAENLLQGEIVQIKGHSSCNTICMVPCSITVVPKQCRAMVWWTLDRPSQLRRWARWWPSCRPCSGSRQRSITATAALQWLVAARSSFEDVR